MTENNTAVDKSIVEQLDFDAKTAKRVGWEAWEFAIAGPHQVEVTNASYGFLKEDHQYVVGIEKRGGVPIPAECDCPADVHREPDCKHIVALASVGGPTVLNAVVNCEAEPPAFPVTDLEQVTTGTDKLQTDGGAVAADDEPDTCPNGDSRCDGPEGEPLPCFDCFEVEQ